MPLWHGFTCGGKIGLFCDSTSKSSSAATIDANNLSFAPIKRSRVTVKSFAVFMSVSPRVNIAYIWQSPPPSKSSRRSINCSINSFTVVIFSFGFIRLIIHFLAITAHTSQRKSARCCARCFPLPSAPGCRSSSARCAGHRRVQRRPGHWQRPRCALAGHRCRR